MSENYNNLSQEQLVAILKERDEKAAQEKKANELAAKFEGFSINDKGNVVIKVADKGYPIGGSVRKMVKLLKKIINLPEYLNHQWNSLKVGEGEGCSFSNEEEKTATKKLMLAVVHEIKG